MALNTSKCKNLAPLRFKGLKSLSNSNYVWVGDAGISASKTHHRSLGSKRVGCDVFASWACRHRAI